jgi:hypothetical protein
MSKLFELYRRFEITRVLLAAVLILSIAGLGYAQDDTEWEWEADEGYHQEEWYDPGDWFNEDDFIDYERDYYLGSYYDDYDSDDMDVYDEEQIDEELYQDDALDNSRYDYDYDNQYDSDDTYVPYGPYGFYGPYYGYSYYTYDWYDDDSDFDAWYE